MNILPWIYTSIGLLLTDLSSNILCSKHGTGREEKWDREWMERYGIWESTMHRQIVFQSLTAIIGAVAYTADCVAGIETDLINLHQLYLYGLGSLPYYQTVVNVSETRKPVVTPKASIEDYLAA